MDSHSDSGARENFKEARVVLVGLAAPWIGSGLRRHVGVLVLSEGGECGAPLAVLPHGQLADLAGLERLQGRIGPPDNDRTHQNR